MLTLHRASAGSGKTYALTKMFLRLFLSVKYEDNPRRMRSDKELADSLPHILAITFTNKATAEMKQRIISALANLSEYVPDKGMKTPDYFDDFIAEFHTTPEKLRHAARKGLEILLNNYSDFKVSTIDSFFQTVLRTFAYETNLQDNYGVEIETDFINDLSLEAMMEEMDRPSDSSEIRYWIELLMREWREKGKKWNVFHKTDTSIYGDIRKALRQFDSEDYKDVREAIDRMDARSLRESFEKADSYVNSCREAKAENVRRIAAEIETTARGLGYGVEDLASSLSKALKTIASGEMPVPAAESRRSGFLSSALTKKAAIKKLSAGYAPLSQQFWQAVDEYTEEGFLWLIYRELYPFLGLMQLARHFITEFLSENNSIVLAETNSLLRRVISDDDTPFIYERLGSRLNHLLIDEFQDTSRLQWENIRPLISEPLGRGEESLLIGDAKQSIYRFRNADPSIIMQKVPSAFPDAEVKGNTEKENTNYRSDQRIVQFNNMVFSKMPQMLGYGMDALYTNAVQATKNGKGKGYVRIETLPDDATDGEAAASLPEPYTRLGDMAASLLSRGYRQRDIAFLVRTGEQARKVIQSLIDYNASRPEGVPAIDFISEDSLTISSSRGVATLISCLRNIASAASLRTEENKEEDTQERHSKRIDWQEIRSELSFFVASHPDMAPDEQIEQFFAQTEHTDKLGDTVREMQSTTLPALTEALTATFIPESIRSSDAPFLAAFQDAVLDYSSSHVADISSFLSWWDLKGSRISITSPADTDAVQIMTVHKSKGIEFGVVIIPECDWDTLPSGASMTKKMEWKWVRPEIDLPEDIVLPDFVPVKLSPNLIGTPHEKDFENYRTLYLMDSLNAMYVAFTRAVHELYIFLPPQKESKKKKEDNSTSELPKRMGWLIPSMIYDEEGDLKYANPDNDDKLPLPNEFSTSEPHIIEFGSLLGAEEIEEIYRLKDEKRLSEGERKVTLADSYYVNPDINFLKYTESAPGTGGLEHYLGMEEEDEEEVDTDPRSEGNLLHAAMEWVITESDAGKALLRLKTAGAIQYSDLDHYRELLGNALEAARPYGWFAPGWEVKTERPILQKDSRPYRPDRIMVNSETGEAVVVDFKFGEKALKTNSEGKAVPPKRHIRQVAGYVNLLKKTGLYTKVSGYLWYVRANLIQKVDNHNES